MESIYDNDNYIKSITETTTLEFLDFNKLKCKSLLISGASGLIGSFLIDVLMYLNTNCQLECTIYALCRDRDKFNKRFNKYLNNNLLKCIIGDINYPVNMNMDIDRIDYVLHLASNTHPNAYAIRPIETINTNIIGTKNMLDLAEKYNAERFVFASTCEIYGENKGDIDKFSEDYLGYINCNSLRAGYPESKRCGEAMCQAYISQKDMNIVIARFARTYGPTMLMSDSKAISQFLKNGIKKEDIVLKSEGKQLYSYTHVADAVSGLLKIMFDGRSGEAYNIADEKSNISLRDLAEIIARESDSKVVFDMPNKVEQAGFSKVTKSILDASKLKRLGWFAQYDIKKGINNTLKILKKSENNN